MGYINHWWKNQWQSDHRHLLSIKVISQSNTFGLRKELKPQLANPAISSPWMTHNTHLPRNWLATNEGGRHQSQRGICEESVKWNSPRLHCFLPSSWGAFSLAWKEGPALVIWNPYTHTHTEYSNYNLFIMLSDWIPNENTSQTWIKPSNEEHGQYYHRPLHYKQLRVHIQKKSAILQSGANNTIYCWTSAKPSCWLWILEKGIDTSPVFNSGAEVEQMNSFRFLGINITEDVSWSSHITTLGKKAKKKLSFSWNSSSTPVFHGPQNITGASRWHILLRT